MRHQPLDFMLRRTSIIAAALMLSLSISSCKAPKVEITVEMTNETEASQPVTDAALFDLEDVKLGRRSLCRGGEGQSGIPARTGPRPFTCTFSCGCGTGTLETQVWKLGEQWAGWPHRRALPLGRLP